MTATRLPASGRRRRNQGYHSSKASVSLDGQPLNAASSHPYNRVDNPSREELRRVHDEFYSMTSDRRRRSNHEMASHGNHRRDSISSARLPEVTIREGRRKHDSSSRRRREKVREEVDSGRVYVYRYLDDDPRDSASRSAPRRRASAPRATSKYESDRTGTFKPEMSRRHAERRAPSYGEWDGSTSRNHTRSSSEAAYARSTVGRTVSLRESRVLSASRPPLTRSQTTTRKTRQPSYSTTPIQTAEEHLERKTSSTKKTERPPGIISSIFGLPKPPDPRPEMQVECLTCLSDVPISKSAKLACKHRMCNSCLRRIFTMSVSDPQHMPPKCCTQDHIPLKHVEKLFDLRFKKKWNLKYQEYTTKNRVYCPARGCGEWIKPSHIHTDTSGGSNTGRKYGKCTRCRTKVCTTCNGKWHTSRECPKDEATQQFAEIAKKEGWQRCFSCLATVELKEGCNHMTCRCQAEFCMMCGLKWKTCDCPWFTYEAVENDRLNHMDIRQRIPIPGVIPNPALGYQEELDRRREQERRDENLARRMQVLGLDGADDNNFVFPPPPPVPAHVMNQDFLRRVADIHSATYNAANADAVATTLAGLTYPPPRPPVPPLALRLRPRITTERQSPPPRLPLRVHSTASRQYNNRPTVRASERLVPSRVLVDYESEAQRHLPNPILGQANLSTASTVVAETDSPHEIRRHGSRHSAMAGLTRGSGEGRVDEWRRHVGKD